MPKPIDITKRPKKEKDLHDKVSRKPGVRISVLEQQDDNQYRVASTTNRRELMGLPPVEIINPSLEAALNDLDVISG